MNFVIQNGTDNESFQNTGEHTPIDYPRSDEAREGSYVENLEVSDGNTVNDEAGANADQQ